MLTNATSVPVSYEKLQYKVSKKAAASFVDRGLADSLLIALNEASGLDIFDDFLDGPFSDFQQHRYAMAILLLDLYFEHYPHRVYPGWQALPYKRLRHLFRGEKSVTEGLRSGAWFENNHRNSRACCKSARLFPEHRQVIAEVLRHHRENSVLVDHTGKQVEPQHAGLIQYGKTKPLLICNVRKWVPINGQVLELGLQYMQELIATESTPTMTDRFPNLAAELIIKLQEYRHTKEDPAAAFFEFLERVRTEIEYLLPFVNTGLPNPIQMSTSGRLYGPYLQRCCRVVRKLALHGMYSYDFAACHHVIFQQSARDYGINCPLLDQYLVNKKKYRETLAKDLGVGVRQAKEALIALVYGAGISHSERYGKPAAIPSILGPNGFQRANSSKRFKGLASELKLISNAIYDHATKKNGYLLNARLLTKEINKNSRATLLAHLIQGRESQMLNTAISTHGRGCRSGSEVVLLPLHDGWVTQYRRDPRAVENKLHSSRKTNIAIKVECEKYNLIDEPETNYRH